MVSEGPKVGLLNESKRVKVELLVNQAPKEDRVLVGVVKDRFQFQCALCVWSGAKDTRAQAMMLLEMHLNADHDFEIAFKDETRGKLTYRVDNEDFEEHQEHSGRD